MVLETDWDYWSWKQTWIKQEQWKQAWWASTVPPCNESSPATDSNAQGWQLDFGTSISRTKGERRQDFMFWAWLPCSLALVLEVTRPWFRKAAEIVPHVGSWAHGAKPILCTESGMLGDAASGGNLQGLYLAWLCFTFASVLVDSTQISLNPQIQSQTLCHIRLEFQNLDMHWNHVTILKFAMQCTSSKYRMWKGLIDCWAARQDDGFDRSFRNGSVSQNLRWVCNCDLQKKCKQNKKIPY